MAREAVFGALGARVRVLVRYFQNQSECNDTSYHPTPRYEDKFFIWEGTTAETCREKVVNYEHWNDATYYDYEGFNEDKFYGPPTGDVWIERDADIAVDTGLCASSQVSYSQRWSNLALGWQIMVSVMILYNCTWK